MKSTLLALVAFCLLAIGAMKFHHNDPSARLGTNGPPIAARTAPDEQELPHIGNCPIFPADNIWNTPVDNLPKDVRSDLYLRNIGLERPLHPDFGTNLGTGIPFTIIAPGTTAVAVDFRYRDESDPGPYPIPPDALIEGGPRGDGDRHVLLLDAQRCLLYELFAAWPQANGSWKADSGIRMDLTGNTLRGAGFTSADAAGLPILPGLVRFEEVQSGAIHHAIRFTIPRTQAAYIWPARHKASSERSLEAPPMGLRMRLRADFDISKFSRSNQVILTALQRYGIILADNGSSVYITGVSDKRWDDSDLHRLTRVSAKDFEVVDESSLQLLPDSGRVDPVRLRR